MDFAFTDDQLLLRDAVRALLTDRCTAADVRRVWQDEGGPGFDPALWGALAEMGALGLLAGEEAGGMGLGMLELVLVLEETGRVAMPGPLVEHAAAAVPALAAAAALGDADAAGWLAGAVTGTLVVSGGRSADAVASASAAGLVLVAEAADLWVHPAASLTLDPVTSVDGAQRRARVTSPAARPLVGGGAAAFVDRGALGVAAQQLGLAHTMIDMTVGYVKERRQFGVPVGSFQAVKHHLADALLGLAYARPAVYRAAYAIDHGEPTAGRDVSFAKLYADRAAARAARAALQCHGAIGYTFEHDLHLWMKRVWVLERSWGEAHWHRSRVADAVLGPRARSTP